MKIVEENVSLVCNNEVLAVLQQSGAGSRQGAQRKTLPSENEARLRSAALCKVCYKMAGQSRQAAP